LDFELITGFKIVFDTDFFTGSAEEASGESGQNVVGGAGEGHRENNRD
jgi:hypothetical protein